ncbi:hypothetical protein FRC17_001245 [Serendipita sp. 399]|nr:hypothetical protein FRC17_001245 [Serendipita sp. 399]
MVKVYLNDVLVAEGENPPVVEGNYYFPPEAIKQEYYADSETHASSLAPNVLGKGNVFLAASDVLDRPDPPSRTASYYNLKVGETTVNDAAWYYPAPFDAAVHIKNHVAFYKNKVVIRDE